jgi:cobalt-zinc-cadmium resistance protein CzcA
MRTDNNFMVSQTLPFPTLFLSNAAYHNAQIKGSEWNAAITKNELLFSIKSLYTQVQFLQAYGDLLLQQDSSFVEFARVAALRFEKGEGTLLEKMSAESRLQEVRNILFQNKSDIQIYFTHLRTLVNSPTPFSIPKNDYKKMELALNGDSAYVNNPMVKYFEQQIEIAEAAKKVEMNKMLPDITLGYFNQTLIGNPIENGFATSANRFQGVQIGLSIPLWFIPQKAKTSAAKISEEIAKTNLEAKQNDVQGQYKELIQEYMKLKNSVAFFEQSQLPQSTLIAAQSQKAFSAGEIGYFEHSQNLMQVLQIKSSYLHTLHQYNQSVYKIQFITAAL